MCCGELEGVEQELAVPVLAEAGSNKKGIASHIDHNLLR